MATKKTTTKKAPVKKASAPKKRTAKKSPVKKSSSSSLLSLRNQIRLEKEDSAFMTFRVTRQTLYWLVLGAVVIMFTLWLTKLQSDIQDLYDQVDASTMQITE